MSKISKKTAYITQAALIAALYTVLTMVAAGFDLASGAFTPAAIPGLTLGCLLSNILTGCVLPDVIFGTLATLLGALGSCALRKNRFLCAIPPIVSNALIIPFVLTYAYHIPGGIPFFMLTVGLGELISCMGLGQLLLQVLLPFRGRLFNPDNIA